MSFLLLILNNKKVKLYIQRIKSQFTKNFIIHHFIHDKTLWNMIQNNPYVFLTSVKCIWLIYFILISLNIIIFPKYQHSRLWDKLLHPLVFSKAQTYIEIVYQYIMSSWSFSVHKIIKYLYVQSLLALWNM